MRRRYRVLAVAAVISTAMYSLAYGQAWGPDGKSMPFPFRVAVETDEGAKTVSGIALYDVESGTVKRVYEEEGSDLWMSGVLWREDGKSLVAAGPRKDRTYRVLLVGLDGKAETIAALSGVEQWAAVPPILTGDELLVGPLERRNNEGGHLLFFNASMNLDSGKVEERWPSTDGMLGVRRTAKGDAFYLRKFWGRNESEVSGTFGVFDENGKERDLHVFSGTSGPAACNMVPSPDGTRFAVHWYFRPGKVLMYGVQILDASGNEVKFIDFSENWGRNIAWFGDSLWSSALVCDSVHTERDWLGFLIASVDSEKKWALRLFDERRVDHDWEVLARLRPTMLPDGKTVAVPSFGKPGPDGSPTALVLLDAAEPERNPRYIPVPLKEGESLPARQRPAGHLLLQTSRRVFSHLCHQEPARSWVIARVTLPLCARCTGVYAGAALAALTLFLARFDPSRSMLWLFGAAMLQMGVLGFNPFVEPPTLRMLSGSLFSAGAVYFLWLPLRARIWGNRNGRRWPFVAAAAVAVAVPQALVRVNAPWAAPVVEALALAGVAVLALMAAADGFVICRAAFGRRPK